MNYHILLRIFAGVLLTGLAAGCGNENPSATAGQNGPGVIGTMRVKQLTRDLALTDEQQQKVKLLIEQETAQIANVDETANLSITQRAIRVGELQKESYERMKPLLTPAQLDKLEQMLSKAQKRKKRSN
jgi:Spy/CpxP family protein refolding chaperone